MKTNTDYANDYSKRSFLDNADFYFVRYGGIFAVILFKVWGKIFRRIEFVDKFSRPIEPHEMIVFAGNHQRRIDAPVIFAAPKMRYILRLAPVKFLTWHKYYYSAARPVLYMTGCYPTHGEGIHGVSGAVHYALKGYRVFVFPEGKRISDPADSHPHKGIGYILSDLPDARLILVRIHWRQRERLFSRPKIVVTMGDAPSGLKQTSPKAIMKAIYEL